MEKYHATILNQCSDRIVRTLNLSTLLPHLLTKNLLTEVEIQRFENRQDNASTIEKNTEFLRVLKTKGSSAFALFLEALKDENQHLGHGDLYRMLQNKEEEAVIKRSSEIHPVYPNTSALHSHQPLRLRSHLDQTEFTLTTTTTTGAHIYNDGRNPQPPPKLLLAIKQKPASPSGEPSDSNETKQNSYSENIPNLAPNMNIMQPQPVTMDHHETSALLQSNMLRNILDNHLKTITQEFADQLTGFQSEVDLKLEELEEKFQCRFESLNHDQSEPFSPRSRSISTATSRSSNSSHGSGRSSNVYDENFVVEQKARPYSAIESSKKYEAKKLLSKLSSPEEGTFAEDGGLPKLNLSKRTTNHTFASKSLPSLSTPSNSQVDSYNTKNNDTDIPCTCKPSQIPPILFNFKAYFVFWKTDNLKGRIRDHIGLIQENLCTFDISEESSEKKEIEKYSSRQFVCALVNLNGNITLIGGCLNTSKGFNLEFHQLQLKNSKQLAWEPVASTHVELSTSNLDPDNCVCSNYHNGIIILITILSNSQYSQDAIMVYFHNYSTVTKKWKSASLSFSQLRSPSNIICKPHSCVITSKTIYYSLIYNNQVYLYFFNLELLTKDNSSNDPKCLSLSDISRVEINPNVKQCFLCFFNNTVITITVTYIRKKSHIEVKSLSASRKNVKGDYQFDSIITIVAVNTLTDNRIAIVYHNAVTNKCYLKDLNIDE